MKGSIRHAVAATALLVAGLGAVLSGCRPAADTPEQDRMPKQPVEAVRMLAADLRRNDLAAYARHALPPDLHARLQARWRDGATVWPLSELPLHAQLPAMLSALSAPDAERALLDRYRRQFAGAHGELRSTAAALGLFAAQYVQRESRYSDFEREHYVQAVAALGRWGQQAPLGDPARAAALLDALAPAARATGLGAPGQPSRPVAGQAPSNTTVPAGGAPRPGPIDAAASGQVSMATDRAAADPFARAGMDGSLQRLGPFIAALKQGLAAHYGLDLDAALDSVQVDEVERRGDRARVRLRYTLAGSPIDAQVELERHGSHWYLTDLLRHARDEAARAADGTAAGAAPATTARR